MTNELIALQERIAELQEQNTCLRESAATFSELAERLNQALREERSKRSRRQSPQSAAEEQVRATA